MYTTLQLQRKSKMIQNVMIVDQNQRKKNIQYVQLEVHRRNQSIALCGEKNYLNFYLATWKNRC